MADRMAAFEQSSPTRVQFFDPSYFDRAADFYARWFESAMKVSQEITEIAQTRINEELAAWAKLATCRGPKDFVDYQHNRVQQVTANAAEDVSKVSGLIASMMQDSTIKKAA
jgi:hypothetical protein